MSERRSGGDRRRNSTEEQRRLRGIVERLADGILVVDENGVIYQKDLGDKTQDVAVAMADYNPGDGWSRVVEEEPQYVAKKR